MGGVPGSVGATGAIRGAAISHRAARRVLPFPTKGRIPGPSCKRAVVFLDGSSTEGQLPKARAPAVRVWEVGKTWDVVVDKVVYGAVSHGEVQAVAEVIKGLEE